MCNDIGEAAYTQSLIAAALYEQLARLPKVGLHPQRACAWQGQDDPCPSVCLFCVALFDMRQ